MLVDRWSKALTYWPYSLPATSVWAFPKSDFKQSDIVLLKTRGTWRNYAPAPPWKRINTCGWF